MTDKRAFQIAKEYLKTTLGLYANGARFSDRHGDRTLNATIFLVADNRHFEVFLDWTYNEIRLTEIHSSSKFRDFATQIPRTDKD